MLEHAKLCVKHSSAIRGRAQTRLRSCDSAGAKVGERGVYDLSLFVDSRRIKSAKVCAFDKIK